MRNYSKETLGNNTNQREPSITEFPFRSSATLTKGLENVRGARRRARRARPAMP